MIKRLKEILTLLRGIPKIDRKITGIEKEVEELKILCGTISAGINKNNADTNINNHEFKVFSQFGDDGIIQYLISKIPIANKTFIEFGVEDFFESNTRFLLMKDNWEGFVMDGSEQNISRLIKSNFYWKYQLEARTEFITRENINSILEKSGFDYDTGILSIDLDGVDYWIWKEINKFNPRILILEFNSIFGISNHWTVPYSADFQRFNAHYSGLYFGASLPCLIELSNAKGYDFIGCNSSGNNAYFVRKDINTIPKQNINEGYKVSKFRESRDIGGNLNFIAKEERLAIIKGMRVFNTLTNSLETIT